MKIAIFFGAGLLCLPWLTMGQQHSLRLEAAYAGGNLTHPGVSLGAYLPLSERIIQKDPQRTVRREWRLGADLGVYHHRRLHTGAFLSPRLEWVRTTGGGFQYGFGLGAGYLRTIIPDTYTVFDDGTVEERTLAGNHHAILMPSFRLGRTFRDSPLSWFLRSQVMVQVPYFEGTNLYVILQTGLSFNLKNQRK